MRNNKYFTVQYRKYNGFAWHFLIGATLVMLFPQVNAGEPPKEPVFSDDAGFSKETGFSQETGFSKESTSGNEAGLTKEINITTRVERDSNPDMTSGIKEPVWIYSITPQFLLNYNDEVNRWYLDAEVLVQRHSNERVLVDREDPRFRVGWDRTYESGMFGISADYIERSSRQSELATTGVFNNIDNTEKVKTLAAKWEHAIAPRWTVLTEGAYSEIKFSNPITLGDYTLGEVKSKLTYANSETLNTYAQLGYALLSPDQTFNKTHLGRFLVGADYQISEALTISSRAGIYNLSGRQSDTDWEAGIRAEYIVGRMNYTAELNRELGASGVGGFQTADTFRLGWLFDVTEVDRIGADYNLYKAKEDTQVGLDELEYREISAFYERVLSSHWLGRATGSFRELESGDYSNGNIIGVSLIYRTLSF